MIATGTTGKLLEKHLKQPIKKLFSGPLAVARNILIACNRTTADFILTSVLMDEDYPIVVEDYSGYLERAI